VKGAVAVGGDVALTAADAQKIADYCEKIAAPFELLSLREELERRMRVAYHLQSFTEKINSVDPDEAYAAILRHSTELLRSERGSLLLFDEAANELQVKAAVGPRAKNARDVRVPAGEGISGTALREGRPLVVRDVGAAGHSPAPAERKYKTGSFISYPLIVGNRRVGVLNMTDKAGGGVFDDLDLNLLDMFAPQMALALDRAEWHQKATQFQLLSITDALTGLLNRRYLEERLGEELERSKRHRFPMSFLMIDIDNFKEYNVLLPQTSLSEAHVIAERIRRRVERTSFEHRESQPGGAVTVSIGLSSFGPKVDTPESIIGAADQALYLAKSRGKNRIEAYSAPALNTPS
jgi:GGDEF domain-containing protein